MCRMPFLPCPVRQLAGRCRGTRPEEGRRGNCQSHAVGRTAPSVCRPGAKAKAGIRSASAQAHGRGHAQEASCIGTQIQAKAESISRITVKALRTWARQAANRAGEIPWPESGIGPGSAAARGYVADTGHPFRWFRVQMYSTRPRISCASLTCANKSSSRTSSPIDRPCGAYTMPR